VPDCAQVAEANRALATASTAASGAAQSKPTLAKFVAYLGFEIRGVRR
jgi:hypothetical protein